MTDLVKRLRERADWPMPTPDEELIAEAADRLERLEGWCAAHQAQAGASMFDRLWQRVERLEAALRSADAVLSGCECAKHWSSAEAAVIRHAREKIDAALTAEQRPPRPKRKRPRPCQDSSLLAFGAAKLKGKRT